MFRRESQRQNVEEDRRGYGGRFEESDCGSEAWEEIESPEKGQGTRTDLTSGKSTGSETREKVGEKIVGRDDFEERDCGPRRLPHVTHRGGEHSHGSKSRGVRLKKPRKGPDGEASYHVRLQSPAQ